MSLMIKKRTGELVPFNKDKISRAIFKAQKEVYPNAEELNNYGDEIAELVENVAKEMDEPLGVEDIQELVEDYLTDYDRAVGKRQLLEASRAKENGLLPEASRRNSPDSTLM